MKSSKRFPFWLEGQRLPVGAGSINWEQAVLVQANAQGEGIIRIATGAFLVFEYP